MFKNIFLKTLFEKRWSTIIWFIAIAVFCLLIVVLFPTFKDSFGQALTDVPDSMKSLLGDASDYQNINGYIDIQVINQMVFLTLIMSIILGTNLLSGEESNGTLQTLLAQPVSRTKVYFHKLLALLLILLIGVSGIILGTVAGVLPIGELSSLNMSRLLQATLMLWLVTTLFGVLSFVIGAITGRKGLAGIVVGFIAFSTYMITALAGTAEVLKTVNYLSPFKYFNTPSVMKNGLDSGNLTIFVASIALFVVIGWIVFRRRDIYQK